MLNPALQASTWPLGILAPAVVLDDVLAEPDSLRQLAARHAGAFARSAANAFPGLELPLPDGATATLVQALEPHYTALLGVAAGACLGAHARLSLVTLPPSELRPIQRQCHRDRLGEAPGERIVAAVLYLFEDPLLGGTAFFTPRQAAAATEQLMARMAQASDAEADALLGPRAYLTQSNAYFERVGVVPARWNRLVAYDGQQFHGSCIAQPERLHPDPLRGRLTLNLFARYRGV